ncbi:uncharacterized protein [Haliotis asinina]|uniref:uncharacterized protein n=1 Tax=Haliotis asinina TaxID=109174 RepID=UPI003531E7CF
MFALLLFAVVFAVTAGAGLVGSDSNRNIDERFSAHKVGRLLSFSAFDQQRTRPEESHQRKLRNDKNITITEADKGKAAVIMDTPDFHDLVNKTLSDTSTYKILPKDPTAKLERQHKKTLKTLHDSNQINDTVIINLVSSCSQTSYFTWQNNIYQQIHGLPMGSPLSPLITEIFMTIFEESALSTSPFQPLCWYRKVDDTFTILDPNHNPAELLDHLNKQHARIQFTMEVEAQHKLPFLDVSLDNSSERIVPTVYRLSSTNKARHSLHPSQTCQSHL